MKALAKMILEIMWKYVVSTLSEIELKAILKVVVTEWCEEHLNPAEVVNEVKDGFKWLKENL